MTPADIKLCRDIAVKDGWELRKWHTPYRMDSWKSPDGFFHAEVPDCLTDPAETVRMSKELIKAGWRPTDVLNFATKTGKAWCWCSPGNLTRQDESYKRATAQAYLAMETGE